MIRTLLVPAFALSALAFLACGSDTTGSGGGGSGGGKTQGFVECGSVTCQPGQHCFNLLCEDGCQSNVNCAADQTCQDIDPDSHVGTCMNNGTGGTGGSTPATKDCNAFCAKAQACNAPNLDQCQQICAAASSACVSCVIDSNCGTGCEQACSVN